MRETGFVNEANLNLAGIWSLGLLQMDFFYREKPWYAGQFVRKVIPKIDLTQRAAPFFSTLLNMQRPKLLSVLVRSVDDTFRNAKISLPVENGKINFSFMEKFIAALEAQRIAEIKAYLLAAGLTNYTLTKAEKDALQQYKNKAIFWSSFNLETLFGASTRGKRLKSADRVPGKLPFVTAGEAEEGVSAYIGNLVEIFPGNTTTIDMFGSAKYRCYDYGGDDHIAVVHTENLPKCAAIFVTTAVHKAAHTGKFDYGRNFYAKDADALDIMLPCKDGKPDYAYMELLISAIQKMVIKDVVLYAEEKSAAKTAVNG